MQTIVTKKSKKRSHSQAVEVSRKSNRNLLKETLYKEFSSDSDYEMF